MSIESPQFNIQDLSILVKTLESLSKRQISNTPCMSEAEINYIRPSFERVVNFINFSEQHLARQSVEAAQEAPAEEMDLSDLSGETTEEAVTEVTEEVVVEEVAPTAKRKSSKRK